MAKINWRHCRTAWLIAGIVFLVAGPANYIVWLILDFDDTSLVAMCNYLYLLPVCLGIFVPAQNFHKLMHLGGKRLDFFKSSLLTYVPVCAVVSLLSVVANLTVDRWMVASGEIDAALDLLNAFEFMEHGAVIAFLQMTAFLIFASCAAHTLTLIQGRWYGWVCDAMLVAFICMFAPVKPLLDAMVWFWYMAIFHSMAAVQILFCLAVSAALYWVSSIPIRSRAF
jgi:hypothetical protein